MSPSHNCCALESDQFLAEQVVRWQAECGRNHLPWQNTRDPYRVWLSEIMLQQTQVATVLAYFTRFTNRFPTVEALAAASADEVMGLWAGLGYYSRARNLHRCAQIVQQSHDGVFPATAKQLQALPGIGRSTAAAIAALCFGERVAILDGNVKRVLTRFLGFDSDLSKAEHERRLWARATEVLPTGHLLKKMAGYTQGMMDLGATVCHAKKPLCGSCPVRARCVAFCGGEPEKFPVNSRKVKRSAQAIWLLWARCEDGALWLSKRPSPGVWAGLYCLPLFEDRPALQAVLPIPMHEFLQEMPVLKHVLTHKDLYLHPVQLTLPQQIQLPLEGSWLSPSQWRVLGLPAPLNTLLRA